MQYKGLTFTQTVKGYKVTANKREFKDFFTKLNDATEWLYNMADNNDIGNEFVRRIYAKLWDMD